MHTIKIKLVFLILMIFNFDELNAGENLNNIRQKQRNLKYVISTKPYVKIPTALITIYITSGEIVGINGHKLKSLDSLLDKLKIKKGADVCIDIYMGESEKDTDAMPLNKFLKMIESIQSKFNSLGVNGIIVIRRQHAKIKN